MKRGNRILSFILVLSLLFSSLVFTSSASTTDEQDEYYVDENAELFQPTAHYTEVTENNVKNVITSLFAEGSETTDFYSQNIYGGSNLKSYVVSSETTENYVMIVPSKTAIHNGKVTDHSYITTYINESFKYDSANPAYYIFEMDVATESGILPLYYQVVARNHDNVQDNGNTVDAWGSSWVPSSVTNSLYMTMTPGIFHHVTFVCDVDNNAMYVYIDNQLAATQENGVTSELMHSYYKDSGASIRIDGFRIQINNGIPLNSNMSYCFKEIYEKMLTGSESASLKDYAGKPTLQGWTGNRYEGHADNKLPSLISVNGVEYNNTVDASYALNSYRENNEAELMRSVFSGDITVDCHGLIHTYAAEVSLKEGPHATLTKIDGSTWQATLHSLKYSTELVLSNPSSVDLSSYLKYNLAGNIISEIKLQHSVTVPQNSTEDEKKAIIAEVKAHSASGDIMQSDRGNNYLYVYDNYAGAFDSRMHFYLNAEIPHNSSNSIAGHEFIVFDFDIFSESELINIYNGFIPRSLTNNAPLSATSFFLTSSVEKSNYIKIRSGEWSHFTFVGDVATGKAYVYINNQLVKTIESGLYKQYKDANGDIYALDGSSNKYPLSDVTINMFRCMQIAAGDSGDTLTQNMSVCVDNFDARFVDGDHTLIAGMDDLSGWVTNLYGNGYQFDELPAIAAVDGVEYYDTYSLTEALTPAYPTTASKKIVLLREFKGNFTVNCNATIEARGFDSHISIGADCSKSTSDGIVTVTCPLADTVTYTDFTGNNITDGSKYKSDVEGNTITSISTGNPSNSPFLTIGSALQYNSNDPYLYAYANQTISSRGQLCTSGCKTCFGDADADSVDHNKNNLFINMSSNPSEPFTVGTENGAVGYYVIDFDVECIDNMLPGFDVSVVMRQGNTSSGFPFSDEIYVGNYVTAGDNWAHVTIIGDLANNVAKIYIDGQYRDDAGKAVRTGSSYLGSNTTVNARGFRVELTRNNIKENFTENENVGFDNFAHRLFVSDNYSELAAAVESGDLTTWSGYTAGRSGNIIAPIAIVNGTPYASQSTLELALVGDKIADVEIISNKLTALNVNCNAVINTNGFPVNITYGSEFTSEKNGNIVTVSGHFVENMHSIVSADTAAILNAIKYPADDNLLSYVSISDSNSTDTIKWGQDGGRGSSLITNSDNGNVFYNEYIVGSPEGKYGKDDSGNYITYAKAGNDYVNYSFSNVNLTKEEGYNKYIIVDFDFAYQGTLDGLVFQVIPRGKNTYWPTTQQFKNLGIADGVFVHITAVYDYTTGNAYMFVNGDLYNNVTNGALNANGVTAYANGESISTYEFRVGSNSTSTIYLDNLYVRSEKLPSNNTIATAISAGSIRAWDENVFNAEYNMTDWPSIATVNGIKYSYHDDIQELLDKVDMAEMEYNRQHSDTFTFSSPATVKTNGLDVNYEIARGYTSSFNSTNKVLTVTQLEGESKFKLVINGVEVINKTLPYGTDVREILTEHGFGAGDKVIACDGVIYTGVTWSASPSSCTDQYSATSSYIDSTTKTPTGYLYSDLTLTASGGTVSDKPFLLLDANGTIVSNDYSDTALMNFFCTQGNGTIVLGSDWNITTLDNSITSTSGTMNVCFNTYSIVDKASSGTHFWKCNVASAANFNFYGEGKFDIDQRVKSGSIIYVTYGYTGKILFKNLDIDTSISISHLREGNLELINCDVDAFLVDSTENGLFLLGEDYGSGYSKNPISLTITNSDIDYRYNDKTKESAIITHTIVSTGYALDPKTTVIINNSDIVTQDALIKANEGHVYGDGTKDTGVADKSNMTVYLNKASLVAESLAAGEIKSGSIVFYEDVRTNIEDTTCVAFVQELSKAKTDDGMTPYLYTSHDYASVTWSNGNAELWASGSLPTHEVCKFDSTEIVEKGGVYNFESTATSAPFKFMANLTLSNQITFNFYVPTTHQNAKVYLDGQLIEAGEEITVVSKAGTECYNYSLAFSPEEAAREFAVTVILEDGTYLSRTVSVGLYAESLLAEINSDPDSASAIKNKALLGATLSYIKSASEYSGVNTDLSRVNKVLSSCSVSSVTPTGTDYSTSDLSAYITGALINAATSSKFRFNVKSGVDASKLQFAVDGEAKEYTIAPNGTYVELSLRAYEMTHDIVISYNGTEIGTYNLYTYYKGLESIASGTASGEQREAEKAKNFIASLFSYATTADEYLDAKKAE